METKTKKKIWITLGAIVAVILLAWLIWWWTGPKQMPQVTYNTEEAKIGNIHDAVTATGTIEPVTEVEVGTQVSGIVSRLYVDYNSPVKKGQLIAELDKTNLLNALQQAQTSVNSAQVEFNYQQKNFLRQQKLYQQHMISEKEFDEAEYSMQKAQNSLDVAKIQLKTAQTNLSYATIYSPIDGVVISKAVEEGQTVQAAMNTPTLYTIAADLTDMRVIANVDEADIGSVREGQKVTFTVDAYPSVEFSGYVQQVRQEATTSSNVVTYEVVISAPNPELKLKPGMTATVSILTLERNNVLLVPSRALKFTPEPGIHDTVIDCQGEHKVWTRQGATFQAHAVQVGATTGTQTEILSGIKAGTHVLIGTTDGMPTPEGMPQTGEKDNSKSDNSSPFMPGPPGKKK